MRIINKEENDVMSAFIVDQMIKSIIIKFDSVFEMQNSKMEKVN